MKHDENREWNFYDEENKIEDDQHEGRPVCPPHPGVGGQQSRLNLLSISKGIQEKCIEYCD